MQPKCSENLKMFTWFIQASIDKRKWGLEEIYFLNINLLFIAEVCYKHFMIKQTFFFFKAKLFIFFLSKKFKSFFSTQILLKELERQYEPCYILPQNNSFVTKKIETCRNTIFIYQLLFIIKAIFENTWDQQKILDKSSWERGKSYLNFYMKCIKKILL